MKCRGHALIMELFVTLVTKMACERDDTCNGIGIGLWLVTELTFEMEMACDRGDDCDI